MKRLFFTITSLLCALQLQAQEMHVDEIYIDTRATFHQQTQEGVYDSHFQGDFLNLHIKGQLSDNLTLRVRQRLNKKIDERTPSTPRTSSGSNGRPRPISPSRPASRASWWAVTKWTPPLSTSITTALSATGSTNTTPSAPRPPGLLPKVRISAWSSVPPPSLPAPRTPTPTTCTGTVISATSGKPPGVIIW